MRKAIFIILVLLPSLVFADPPANFSDWWNSLTQNEQVAYLAGYKAGVADALGETLSAVHSPDYNEKMPLRDQVPVVGIFDIQDNNILSKVISKLYENPENSYIQINDMILVARDKIAGKQIETELQNARRKAFIAHDLKSKHVNKDK